MSITKCVDLTSDVKPPSLTSPCHTVTGGSPDVTKLSPNCHQTVTRCHEMSPMCHRGVTRCHEMSRDVTGCHGGVATVATVTNCHQLSPTVTKLSPSCHQTVTKMSPCVTKCHRVSPSCHHLSLQITEHHGHCRCDMYLLGWALLCG